jgi:hypothetical protein
MNQGMTKMMSANTCNTGNKMMIGIVAMHFAASFVMPMARAMRFRKQQIVQAHNAHTIALK